MRGSALMAMALTDEAAITAFLDPKFVEYSASGTPATVRFADGTPVRAQVIGLEDFTQRPPGDAPDPMGLRRISLVVRLRVLDPIPQNYMIGGLPVDVRFHKAD